VRNEIFFSLYKGIPFFLHEMSASPASQLPRLSIPPHCLLKVEIFPPFFRKESFSKTPPSLSRFLSLRCPFFPLSWKFSPEEDLMKRRGLKEMPIVFLRLASQPTISSSCSRFRFSWKIEGCFFYHDGLQSAVRLIGFVLLEPSPSFPLS